MSHFVHLGRPFEQGRLRLRNRVVHAAILTRLVHRQRPTEAFIRYHENRARGGVAMIVTEPVNALAWQRSRDAYLDAYDDGAVPALAAFARRITDQGCVVLAQIQDRGRGNYSTVRVDRPRGPSALPDDLSGAVPHPLTSLEIEQAVTDFAAAAARLERAGFSGVEISAGHGHLFHQFLAAHSNRRTDRYGGSFEARLTLVREVLAAIRGATGPAFVIGLKLPADDGIAGSIDADSGRRIASALLDPATVDYAAFAWGTQAHTLHWHVPDGHWPRAPFAERIAELRAHANGVPVMALGRIVDPNEAEAILAAGQADLVGVGRALVADPAWTRKALSGRGHAIRPCVSCNTCWASIADASPLACDNNPALTRAEELARPRLAPERRKVVVVGAGVAGLEAAWVAAARGHDVTVLHASAEPGGRARLAASLPGGDGIAGVYDHQCSRARIHGVHFELGLRASAEQVLALEPDRVVLATGAEPAWPDSAPAWLAGLAPCLPDLLRALAGRERREPGTVVVVDEDHGPFTGDAIEWLAERFARVVVLTTRERVLDRACLVTRQGALERLARAAVELVPLAVPDADAAELEAGVLAHRNRLTGARGRVEDVVAVTFAAHRVPRLDLLVGLRAGGIEPVIVGDAFAPRGLLQATREGFDAGLAL